MQFTQISFNSENILFLQSVQQLKSKTKDIDAMISWIFECYIEYGAPHRINLSYACFMNAKQRQNEFIIHRNAYNLDKKHAI